MLSLEQRAQFQDEGFVVVHGIFPDELIHRVVGQMRAREQATAANALPSYNHVICCTRIFSFK